MKSLNPCPNNTRRSGAIRLGSIPGHEPSPISIRVFHGNNQYEVTVPSNSSFGYLKSVISQSLGLKPETCKLFFGGIEKQDDECLQIAGLKNNSEVMLVEDTASGQQGQKVPNEVQENSVSSKGEEAVAEVKKEVDKLEPQVSALQAIIDNGNKVDEKEIIYLTEMLMRQLLKLDGIDAEGEGKIKRKKEVRRVQSLVEKLDTLKARNSNSSSSTQKNVSVSTEWTAFDSSPSSAPPHVVTSASSPSPSPSSAPPVVPSSSLSPTPLPSSAPLEVPSFPPSPMTFSTYTVPYHTPSDMPPHNFSPVPHQYMPYNMSHHTFPDVPHQYTHSAMPSSDFQGMPHHFAPSAMPSSNFQGMPHPAPSPIPYYTPSTHHPYQYYDPSQMTHHTPSHVPMTTPTPDPYHFPPHMPSSNPFAMPSSTNVTDHWERFG